MRTTIDIPDELVKRAKIAATQRGTTLRQLVIRGLQSTLNEAPPKPDAGTLPKLPTTGRKAYDLTNDQIEAILLNENGKTYGRSR